MRKKIIFVFVFLLSILIQSNAEDISKKEDIERALIMLEADFGNSFYEALYSIDELRPYSIIQIDKIALEYNNAWVSPEYFTSQLNDKDKSILIDNISAFIADMQNEQTEKSVLRKIKSWCISENQLNLIAKKIGIGRTNVLNIIMNFLPAPINANTGEVISTEKSDNDGAYYFYSTINQLSELSPKEQYQLFSKIFGELARK